jgi:hypothetical protein
MEFQAVRGNRDSFIITGKFHLKEGSVGGES